jgi:hypothetical protein
MKEGSRDAEREPVAWHVTLRLENDGWLARRPAELRRASRLVHAHLAGQLLAFRIVDTHAHLLLTGARAGLGRRVRNLESALMQALRTAPFERARFVPVATLRHLHNTMPYVLRQTSRHAARMDPAHDGSILPDLLGLRLLPTSVVPNVLLHVPRLDAAELRRWVDWPELDGFTPDPAHLADAAAAALALPDLRTNTPATCFARRAAVHALPLGTAELGRLLRLEASSVRRMRSRPVPAELVRAVERQVRLRTALGTRPRWI